MKTLRKFLVVAVIVGILGTAGLTYAATAQTPAEILSGLTGKTVEDLYKERTAGKTFGNMAQKAGKLKEFKEEMLKQKKAILDERVKAGVLTQEQAEEIYNTIKSHQAQCDGTGSKGIGKKYGAGFGKGRGIGKGICMGKYGV